MSPTRRIAAITGVLFLITFITSIPAKLLYDSVLNHPGYMAGAGSNTRLLLAAFLELILIIANIGTAVVLFPVLKRQSEAASLGYVTARVMECAFIAVGILSVLAIVTLRQDAGGAGVGSLSAVGRSLAAAPARPRLRGRYRQRVAAGLSDVPIAARTKAHGGARARRGAAHHRHGRRRDVRSHQDGRPRHGHRHRSRVHLGAVPRHLPHRQGIQAVSDHRHGCGS